MIQLPIWNLTNLIPSVYDTKSGTAIEMTAKVYGAMRTLIDEYNTFVISINNEIANFESSTTKNYEEFAIGIRQEFQDFIDIINLKVMNQDSVIQDAVNYMKTNIENSIVSVVEELQTSGALNEELKNIYSDILNSISVMDARMNTFTTMEDGSTTGDAELVDARVDYKGFTHENVGSHIRNITEQISEHVTEIETKSKANNDKMFKIVSNNKTNWNSRHSTNRAFRKYDIPFSAPINIITDGHNFYHDFDITEYKNPSNITYYVSPNGSSENDGLTEETPKNLYDFVTNTGTLDVNNITIICLDGVYRDIAIANGNGVFHRNWNIIAKNPGKVIIANIGSELTYVKDGTYTNCYTTTRSNVLKYVQLYDDKFIGLSKVDSENDCNDTPGTWYLDSNNKLYVHLFFDETPTYQNSFALLKYNYPVIDVNCEKQNVNLYLEGISFLGGYPSTVRFSNSATYKNPCLYAKDCDFLFAYDETLLNDAVSIKGGDAYFDNCRAEYSSKDGFNYHANNDTTGKFIEINCVGANNGLDKFADKQPYNNGSTAHDGYVGIRINGSYYNNYGCNVADVNENTKTVNILCSAFDSAYTGADYFNCDFSAQQSGAEMWLDNCRAFGSLHSIHSVDGSNLHFSNCEFENH